MTLHLWAMLKKVGHVGTELFGWEEKKYEEVDQVKMLYPMWEVLLRCSPEP